jgi:hypothetical protein
MAEGAKAAGPAAVQAKKRAALGNITNVAAPGARAAAVAKVAPPATAAVRATLSARPLSFAMRNASHCAFLFSDPGVLALGWAGSKVSIYYYSLVYFFFFRFSPQWF